MFLLTGKLDRLHPKKLLRRSKMWNSKVGGIKMYTSRFTLVEGLYDVNYLGEKNE